MNGQPTAQNTRECGADGRADRLPQLGEPCPHPGPGARLERRARARAALEPAHPRDADLPLRRDGLDPRSSGSSAPTRPCRCPSSSGSARSSASRPALPDRQRCLHDRDGATSPTSCCRRRSGARRPAPSPTSIERCTCRSRRSIRPARRAPTWTSLVDFSPGWASRTRTATPLVGWSDPEGAFEAWKAASKGYGLRLLRPVVCAVDRRLRHPVAVSPRSTPTGTERLYTDGGLQHARPITARRTATTSMTGAALTSDEYKALDPNGRAWIKAADYVEPPEQPDSRVSALAHDGPRRVPLPHANQDRPHPGARGGRAGALRPDLRAGCEGAGHPRRRSGRGDVAARQRVRACTCRRGSSRAPCSCRSTSGRGIVPVDTRPPTS